MSRAQRLLDLIQLLRSHRFAVTGEQLAAQLGVSIRTLYRDIATLQAQGAHIDGAPGLGYVLRPGFTLPPLMFSVDEIEALVLGSRWVAERADVRLGAAARQALAKIGAVLPAEVRQALDADTSLLGPVADPPPGEVDLTPLRQAIRLEKKLELHYRDLKGAHTARVVWPCTVGYFDQLRVLVAWCELREGFRHFRTDRIEAMALVDQRYPRRRHALLQAWRDSQGIAPARN